jgi:hypothetical protein
MEKQWVILGGRRRAAVWVTCAGCGREFLAAEVQLRRGRGKYCSRKCSCKVAGSIGARRLNELHDFSGANNPNWKGGVSKINSRYKKRFEARYPEKVRAHEIVRRAIKSGALTRQPCIECGRSEDVHAHHEDYSRPLDVRWLCPRHHRMTHGASC